MKNINININVINSSIHSSLISHSGLVCHSGLDPESIPFSHEKRLAFMGSSPSQQSVAEECFGFTENEFADAIEDSKTAEKLEILKKKLTTTKSKVKLSELSGKTDENRIKIERDGFWGYIKDEIPFYGLDRIRASDLKQAKDNLIEGVKLTGLTERDIPGYDLEKVKTYDEFSTALIRLIEELNFKLPQQTSAPTVKPEIQPPKKTYSQKVLDSNGIINETKLATLGIFGLNTAFINANFGSLKSPKNKEDFNEFIIYVKSQNTPPANKEGLDALHTKWLESKEPISDYSIRIIDDKGKIVSSKLEALKLKLKEKYTDITPLIDQLNKPFISKYFTINGTLKPSDFNEFMSIVLDEDSRNEYVRNPNSPSLVEIARNLLMNKIDVKKKEAEDAFKKAHPVISLLCDAFPEWKGMIMAFADLIGSGINYGEVNRLEALVGLNEKIKPTKRVKTFDEFLNLERKTGDKPPKLIDGFFNKFRNKPKFENLFLTLSGFINDSKGNELIKQFKTEGDRQNFSFTVETHWAVDAEIILRQVSEDSTESFNISDIVRGFKDGGFSADKLFETAKEKIREVGQDGKIIIGEREGKILTFKEVSGDKAEEMLGKAREVVIKENKKTGKTKGSKTK